MQKILYALSTHYVLALIISSIIIFFLPPIFDKYQIKLLEKRILGDGVRVCYYDFNNDGKSEFITLFYNNLNEPAVKIYNYDGGLIDQWNFIGKYPELNNIIMFGDYDNNKLQEIYIFTQKGDSILLNSINPYSNNDFLLKNKFIDTVQRVNGKLNFSIHSGKVTDLLDGPLKEIVFSINAGFSLQPRNIYAYSFENDSFTKSPQSGSLGPTIFYDLDNDSKEEIIASVGSPNNIHDLDIPYKDNSAWLMIFDNNLDFLFEPIEFEGVGSKVETRPYVIKDTIYLVSLFHNEGKLNKYPVLFMHDIEGNIIKKRKLTKEYHLKDLRLFGYNELNITTLYLIDKHGYLEELNENLETIRKKRVNDLVNMKSKFIDFDNDGDNEIIIYGPNAGSIIVYRNNFSFPTKLELQDVKNEGRFSVKLNGDKNPNISFQTGNNLYLIDYRTNPLYHLKYFVYLGIYLGILLIILIIQKLQKTRIEKRQAIEKRFAELQLRTIKNQVDPHFTFNILNSMGSLIYKEKPQEAYNYFAKFSKLLRSSLESSDKVARTLKEELNFVRTYLELEKLRSKDKFGYTINISSGVNEEMQIPKMSLQLFAENAIKHGLRHKQEKGKLNIDIGIKNNKLIANIIDNGIGREKARELSVKSTGKGLNIANQFFELYNQYNKSKITYEIIDLFNENNEPSGTKVTISIPLNYEFKIK